jgi:hypothetical protein
VPRAGAVARGHSGDNNVYAFDLAGGAVAVVRPPISKLHPNYSLRAQHSARAHAA